MSKSQSGPSLHIGTYAGIPVFIHWSFGFIFFYIAYQSFEEGLSLISFLFQVALTLTVFLCIVLHEYGHALMARKYGVQTKDIIIFPIGGVARLERIPKKPIQEFLMTLAGPMVNIAIAIILGVLFLILFGVEIFEIGIGGLLDNNLRSFIGLLIVINLFLFLFNMIPAFPMDGGRLVRSSLAMKIGHVRATHIATIIGKICAIGFVGIAFWRGDIILAFIGAFVFYAAHNEGKNNKVLARLSGVKVGDIANATFFKIQNTDLFSDVLLRFRESEEKNFLVFNGEDIVGSFPEQYILYYLKEGISSDSTVSRLMSDRYGIHDSDDSLREVYEEMNETGIAIVGIKKDDQLIGVADRHMISKYL